MRHEGWRRAGPEEREDGHEFIRIRRRGKLQCDGCPRTFKNAWGLGAHRNHCAGQLAQLAQLQADDGDLEMHHEHDIDSNGDGDCNGDDSDSNGDGDADGEADPDVEEEHIADIPDQGSPISDLQCPGCMKVCGHQGALSTHRLHCKVVNGTRCDECEMSFDSKAALDGHNKVHSDKRRAVAAAAAAPAAARVPRVV